MFECVVSANNTRYLFSLSTEIKQAKEWDVIGHKPITPITNKYPEFL
jgi:hypothetical protein